MLTVANKASAGAIRGVISQVPHLDGKAASVRALKSRGPVGFMRVIVLALADLLTVQANKLAEQVGLNLNLPPVYVKIVGTAEETAYMILNPTDQVQYFKKHPKSYLGGWKNLAPARTMAYMSLYNPIKEVSGIKVPILFVGATHDELCPIETVRQAAEMARFGTLLEINTTHFELYQGENFDKITAEMVRFALDCVQRAQQ